MLIKLAGGALSGLISAREKYNKSKSLKSTVEKVINGISRGIEVTKTFIKDKGETVKGKLDKANRKKSAKKALSLFARARNATKRSIERVKTAVGVGKDVEADELEDEKGNKTSSKDPPNEDIVEKEVELISKEEIKEVGKAKGLEVKEKGKNDNGLEDEDGEPTERGYLKILTEAILGDDGMVNRTKGWFGRGKSRMAKWMQDRRERMEARRKEVEEEKKAVQEKMKAKKKKKGGGFLSKLFKGGILGLLATLFIKPIKLLAEPFLWLGGKILEGLGRLIWWGIKKILGGIGWLAWEIVKGVSRGVWWAIKELAGGLGRALRWFGRGIFNMSPKWAQNLFTKMGKWTSAIGRGFSTLGNTFKTGLLSLGERLGGWFSSLTSTIKNISPGGVVRGAWEGVKSFFGKGGWARTALSTVGTAITQIGGRVLAGVVAVGPIGWVIGLGLALWGAYELYKYFKNGKGKFPDTAAGRISQLRMYSYGLNSDNNDKFKKMFELEEIIGRFLKRDDYGEVTMVDLDIQAQSDIIKTLGLNGEDPGPREEATSEWLYGRFIPAYTEFMRVLWNQKEDVKAGELDKLTQKELASLIYDYDPPGEIWDIDYLPFTDVVESSMTREFFDEFHNSIKSELANEWDGIQTKRMNDEDREIKNKNLTSRDNTRNRERLKDGIKRRDDQTKAANWITKHSDKLEEKYKDRSFTSTYGPNGEVNLTGTHHGITLNGIRNGSMLGLSMRNDIPAYNGPLYNYTVGEGNARRISPEEMGSMSLDRVFSLTAEMTGIPEEILWTVAKLEAGLDPLAKSSTSSASGLFQMIDATWETMVKRYGKKYGITPQNANRWIPLQNALMGAEYMRENLANIRGYEKIGLDLATALYFAHFFGGAGVKRFMALYARNPDLPMKLAVSDKVYRANKVVMEGVTMRQFVDMYRARFNDAMNTPPTKYKGYLNHRKAFPHLYENSVPNDRPKDGKTIEETISPNIREDEDEGSSFLALGVTGQLGLLDKENDKETKNKNTFVNFGVAADVAGITDQSKNFTNNGLPTWNDSNDWGDAIVDQIASDYQGDNAGIEMLRSMGLIHKDSKYYLNDDGTYGPKGRSNSYGGGFANYTDIGAFDPTSYTGPRQVLGSGYASPDADAVKVHPIMAGYPFYFTSLYGPRETNIENASKVHGGVDIGNPTKKPGIPIVASGDGKVMRSYRSTSYGEVVYLIHPDGLQTRYAHLSKRLVRNGQEVRAGQIVGLMGDTGTGSGVHLHYEVRKGHEQDSPTINPMSFNVIKKSFKGLYVPTVIDPKGHVDSDEELTDENFQRKQLEALGVPEPTGLEGLEEMQKSILMVDPVTGMSKEDQEEMFKDHEDLQMKNFDGKNFEGYFIDESEDGKLKLTREDNGKPFNFRDWYSKEKGWWDQMFNMKDITDEAAEAARKADEAYNKNVSFRRKQFVNQVNEFNDPNSALFKGLTGRNRPDDEVVTATKDDIKVDVDLDINSKTLEERLLENSKAIMSLTQTFQEYIKSGGMEIKKSGTKTEADVSPVQDSKLFGGESIRSKQRVVF